MLFVLNNTHKTKRKYNLSLAPGGMRSNVFYLRLHHRCRPGFKSFLPWNQFRSVLVCHPFVWYYWKGKSNVLVMWQKTFEPRLCVRHICLSPYFTHKLEWNEVHLAPISQLHLPKCFGSSHNPVWGNHFFFHFTFSEPMTLIYSNKVLRWSRWCWGHAPLNITHWQISSEGHVKSTPGSQHFIVI